MHVDRIYIMNASAPNRSLRIDLQDGNHLELELPHTVNGLAGMLHSMAVALIEHEREAQRQGKAK